MNSTSENFDNPQIKEQVAWDQLEMAREDYAKNPLDEHRTTIIECLEALKMCLRTTSATPHPTNPENPRKP
jgi:hypothetical protein